MDAENAGRTATGARAGVILRDRRGSGEIAWNFEAGICRRPLDWKPHLYPPRVGRNFAVATALGTEYYPAADRKHSRREIDSVPAAVRNRPFAGVCGRSGATSVGAGDGLHDRGTEDRSARLAAAERKPGSGTGNN